MRIDKFLSEVMNKHHFRKDKDLAEWLGVSPAAVSQYRAGTRSMDNEKCVKVALDLDIDPMKVIMATDMDRAERAGQKSLWEVFSQRMATAAASALLVVGVTGFLTPQNAEARTYKPYSDSHQPTNLYYVKCHNHSMTDTTACFETTCSRSSHISQFGAIVFLRPQVVSF